MGGCAVTASDNQLGMAGTRRCVVQDDVLGSRRVRLVQQRVAVVGGGSGKLEGVLSVPPAPAQAVLEPFQGHLVDCLRRIYRDPRGPLVDRVPQEVKYDFGVYRVDPRPMGAVLQGEGGGHPFAVGHCTRDGHCPRAGEVGREGNAGGMTARPAPRCIGGRVAPGLWDPVVPSGAEPPCFEGCGVPSEVGVAGEHLVDTQGQRFVWTGRRVVVEPDLSPGDGAGPGPERRQVLPEPR